MMKTLAQKIKLLRIERGISQLTMAELLNISIPAYSKLETGNTDPNYSRILQVAAVHQLDIRQLLDVGECEYNGYILEIERLEKKIIELESNMIILQGKLIDFYSNERNSKDETS